MSYDIFHGYGLHKIHDSLTEDYDYKENDPTQWDIVKVKTVKDSDGFNTEYAWYTNGVKHIFMFGDTDIVEPDEDYADWVAESDKEASDWFDNYYGFEDEDEDVWESFEEDSALDDHPEGNADFMNDGFERVYGNDLELED